MKQELNEMLSNLKRAFDEIQSAIDSLLFEKGPDGMLAYYEIGRRHGQIAMETYHKLFSSDKGSKLEELNLSKYLVRNMHRDSKIGPNSLAFWEDPDSIRTLYEILEKQGFYDAAKA